VKKKLAALDLRVKIGLVAIGLLVLGMGGYTLVVAPESAQVTTLQLQINNENAEIAARRLQANAGLHPPAIQTADLFRLARAMPDREDMPGIILTLSQVAREAGITFDLIEPVVGGSITTLAGPYTLQRMHLIFNGDFYGLSDFLYQLRSLVAVRNGNLVASGRLFNVDTLNFTVVADSFPQISAELYVDAYIYPGDSTSSGTTTTPSTDGTSTDGTTTTTTPTTTTPDTSLPPTGASASGPTP
jgi:Tfp pilus assembly protein PilO